MHGCPRQGFDLPTGDWKLYVEQAKLYFAVNDIIVASK